MCFLLGRDSSNWVCQIFHTMVWQNTGSIQRYLTPFVSKNFGVRDKPCYQLSSSGGLIRTHHKRDLVELYGNGNYQI